MDLGTRKQFELHARLVRFQRQVEKAHARVSDWLLLVVNPYVAFSTGKDSTCVLSLVREQRPETPAVYFDADCAYPESAAVLRDTPNVICYPASEPLLVTIRRLGLFSQDLESETMRTTVYEPAAQLLDDYGFDGMAYGLRAEESNGRRVHARARGAVFQYQDRYKGVWGCQPIWDWSYMDVWAFIVSRDLPYCRYYDHLWAEPIQNQRLSYWAGESERESGRYARLKKLYPELWNQLIREVPEATIYA